MKTDYFHNFFETWEKGGLLSAFQELLASPEVTWDNVPFSEETEAFKVLENYVDASLFFPAAYLIPPNLRLQYELKRQQLEFTFPKAMTCLIYEANLIHFLNRTAEDSPHEDLTLRFQKQTIHTPLAYSDNIWKKNLLLQGLNRFEKQKYALSKLIQHPHYLLTAPWHLIRYKSPILPNFHYKEEIIPLLFLEPYDINFTEFLSPLNGKATIFIFETTAAFFQMLQFQELMKSLSDPAHLIYILELYPNEQLKIQKWIPPSNISFHPVLLCKKPVIEEAMPLLTAALQQCLTQTDQELSQETPNANWLYHISKRILFKSAQLRLGKSRSLALIESWSGKEWVNPHKGNPPAGKPLGPEPYDFFHQQLAQLAKTRTVRPITAKNKIKLAHVVPQVVDGGHAPSRLLKILFDHANRERFELVLISTERMTQHFSDYPLSLYISEHSSKRGANFLNHLKDISVYLTYVGLTYEQTAKFVNETLSVNEVDIVVFHGPDIINTLSAQMTDVPLRILFEHGTPPLYPGFDSIILSSEEAVNIYAETLNKIGSKAYVLPFAIDVRASWIEPTLKKTDLGVPEDSFIMTTISHYLNARLGTVMCQAIGEILQRNPNTYYMPIGPIDPSEEERIRKIIQIYGVNDRIRFLDTQPNPSQLARSMELYLNEFPFGSCLGILDAMASGTPVISMYDEKGPQQSRYGGVYFGVDKVITSGKIEDYVTLACLLIQDKQLYSEWSKHALKQYEKHADVKAYVKDFEKILETAFIHAARGK